MLYEHLEPDDDRGRLPPARATGTPTSPPTTQIHVQALEMADELSTGIVDQFPRRFR